MLWKFFQLHNVLFGHASSIFFSFFDFRVLSSIFEFLKFFCNVLSIFSNGVEECEKRYRLEDAVLDFALSLSIIEKVVPVDLGLKEHDL